MTNSRAETDAMGRFYADAQAHSREVLKRIDAALKAEKTKKPARPKPQTPYKGSWAESANDPIPQHVKDHAAKKNPLSCAVTIGPINPKFARIFNG